MKIVKNQQYNKQLITDQILESSLLPLYNHARIYFTPKKSLGENKNTATFIGL